jgi:Flp pilus assembly protein TadD
LTNIVAIAPDASQSLSELGALMREKGELVEAENHLRRSIEIKPDRAEPHYNLGLVLMDHGDYAKAAEEFRASIRLDSAHIDTLINLALCRIKLNQPQEAIAAVETAIALASTNAGTSSRLDRTIELLAWKLATTDRERWRHPKQAVELAQVVNRRTNGRNPQVLDTLAAAQAANVDFRTAVQTARFAAQKATDLGNIQFAERIRERVKRYANGQPYSEPNNRR